MFVELSRRTRDGVCGLVFSAACLVPALGLPLLVASVTMAQSVKAFPTAEGFRANAVGGRGGRVVEVTNLDDSGPGSLRSCLEASGPRICVFRVSGTITLKSAIQAAHALSHRRRANIPGGVQIRGTGQPDGDWGVWFVNGAHDIIVRHLRVRMGGNMKHDAGNNLLFYGTAEPGVHDVIVDHCSVSWGSDTQLDWYGSYLDRATFQWNLIGECYMGTSHRRQPRAEEHHAPPQPVRESGLADAFDAARRRVRLPEQRDLQLERQQRLGLRAIRPQQLRVWQRGRTTCGWPGRRADTRI